VFQEVEAPRFEDSRHMKVVMLSAPPAASPPSPLGNIPVTLYVHTVHID